MNYSEAMASIARYQREAPVDVVAVAASFGVTVWEDLLPSGISGKLFRDQANGGMSGYSIVANSAEGYRRRRFTIAHELGHFILHRSLIGDSVSDDEWYRSGLSTKEEAQANRAAADILMPYRLISSMRESGITDPEILADRLEVSSLAMRIRLGLAG